MRYRVDPLLGQLECFPRLLTGLGEPYIFLNTQYSQSPPVSGACGASRILRIFRSTGSIETSHWAVEQTGFNSETSKVA